MRFLSVTLVSFFVATGAIAGNGLPDSQCFLPHKTPRSVVFNVDSSFAADMQSVSDMSNNTDADMLGAADQALQNLMRQSRARVRARINTSTSSCKWQSGTNCIEAHHNSDPDFTCMTTGWTAYAGCSDDNDGSCHVTFCLDNIGVSFGREQFHRILQHELGHVFGLDHPEAGCTGSDGCEGELMCHNLGEPVSERSGDSVGYRINYNSSGGSFINRKVFTGTHNVGSNNVSLNDTGMGASFQPRIACARNVDTCVAVIDYDSSGTSRMKIVSFSGWHANGSWTTTTTRFDGAASRQFATDITISPNASDVYTGQVLASLGNGVLVGHLRMSDNRFDTIHIPNGTGDMIAELPVRVSWDDDLGGTLVLLQQAHSTSGRWQLKKATFDTSNSPPITLANLNFGSLDDDDSEGGTMATPVDFDFDCRAEIGSADDCVVVTAGTRITGARPTIGTIFSHHFTVSGTTVTHLGSTWEEGSNYSAQAVIGVTLGSRLFVSVGRRSPVGSATNTRRLEFSTENVISSNEVASFPTTSDVTSCSSGSSLGLTMGAATPGGGESIAWCPACNSGAGTVVSLQFGHRESNDDDFCF